MSNFSCGLQIRVCDGPDKGRTFPLDSREVTIGRARNPGDRAPGWVLLNDVRISRIHADMVWSDQLQAYRLVHRSETNPTEINGQPVTDAILQVGDVIRVGESALDVQKADFRFGGVAPESIHLVHKARQEGVVRHNSDLDFRDLKREGESHQGNTKSGGRKIALSTRPKFHLEVLGGAQKGQKFPLTGFKIQVGGHQAIDLPEERWWDQDVIIEEAEFPYRSMVWHWRELDNAFEVSYCREASASITLERRVDGTEWIAEMPSGTGSSVFLRPFDLLYVGKTALQLMREEV